MTAADEHQLLPLCTRVGIQCPLHTIVVRSRVPIHGHNFLLATHKLASKAQRVCHVKPNSKVDALARVVAYGCMIHFAQTGEGAKSCAMKPERTATICGESNAFLDKGVYGSTAACLTRHLEGTHRARLPVQRHRDPRPCFCLHNFSGERVAKRFSDVAGNCQRHLSIGEIYSEAVVVCPDFVGKRRADKAVQCGVVVAVGKPQMNRLIRPAALVVPSHFIIFDISDERSDKCALEYREQR